MAGLHPLIILMPRVSRILCDMVLPKENIRMYRVGPELLYLSYKRVRRCDTGKLSCPVDNHLGLSEGYCGKG